MTQTLLQRMPVAEMPAPIHEAWSQLNKLTGEPTFVEVFAKAPDMLNFVMNEFYAKIFFGGTVAQRYKQLARLKLSLIHGCRTCNKQNVVGALEAGITQQEIDAMHDYQSGPFDEADKAVIEFAELVSMDNQEKTIAAPLYEALKRNFNDAQICELGVVTAFVTGFAKLSFVLDLVEREEYCSFS